MVIYIPQLWTTIADGWYLIILFNISIKSNAQVQRKTDTKYGGAKRIQTLKN